MSPLSSFVVTQLINLLESEFATLESDLKNVLVQEVAIAVSDIVTWVNSKLPTNQQLEITK